MNTKTNEVSETSEGHFK